MTKRNLLKSAMESLKVGQPIRLRNQSVELRPPSENSKPSETSGSVGKIDSDSKAIPKAHPHSSKDNTEESGFKKNAVQNGQGPKETPSKVDGVDYEQGLNRTVSKMEAVQNEPGLIKTASKRKPVQSKQGSNKTGSKNNGVQNGRGSKKTPFKGSRKFRETLKQGSLKPKDNYTAIPNTVLRQGNFESPAEFMVYVHLFSYSFGFGRNTCDAGLKQIEAFTGLGRNAVKRALERLTEKKWIKVIQEFEAARVARKWRVFCPYELGLSDDQVYLPAEEMRGSKKDTVQNQRRSESTLTGFKKDPVTGSKMNPYKDNYKNKSKTTLSQESKLPEVLESYFSNLKPETKREGELKAFRELKSEFNPGEISKALNYLEANGDLRKGEKCHSPMAYLTRAMSDVMTEVAKREQKLRQRDLEQKREELEKQKANEEEQKAKEHWEKAWSAFQTEFSDTDDRQEVVFTFAKKHFGMLDPNGEMVKKLAIQRWYEEEFLNQKAMNHA